MSEVVDLAVWRVSSGGVFRYFTDEGDARDYASDRFDYDTDGVPFVTQLTVHEAIAELNRLGNADCRTSFEVMP